MKRIKQMVICLLALTMMLVPGGVYGAVLQDVADTPYEDAVSFLDSLGIMKGDGVLFRPNDEITRGEMTQVLIRVLNLESAAAGYEPQGVFSDVPVDHEFAAAIELGAQMGAVCGTGNNLFEPDNPVTLAEAVKLMVCALGYQAPAEDKGGYPFGYLSIAQQYDLLLGVNITDTQQPMTRGETAILCQNTLEADAAKPISFGTSTQYSTDGETLLEYAHQISVMEGLVTANSVTSLWGINATDSGMVQLMNQDTLYLFELGESSLDQKIGENVKVYYTKDESGKCEGRVVYVKDSDKKTRTVDVKIEDMVSGASSSTSAVYWKDGKTANINLSDMPALLYNGTAVQGYGFPALMELLEGKYGTIRFIDSNNTGKTDVVLVWAYDTYVVDSVDTKSYKVFDQNSKYVFNENGQMNRVNRVLTADQEDDTVEVSVQDASGKQVEWKDLKQNDVLTVTQSLPVDDGKTRIEIRICRDVVAGNLDMASTDSEDNPYFQVDGTKYVLTEEYWNAVTLGQEDAASVSLTLGKTYTFYLDSFGRIAGASAAAVTDSETETQTGSAELKFGVVTGYSDSGSFDEVSIRIYNGEENKVYETADKVSIDGQKYSGSSVKTALDAVVSELGTTYFDTEGTRFIPVLFRINGNGEVSYLDTCIYREGSDDVNSLQVLNDNGKTEQLVYVSTVGSFNYKYPVSNAQVIVVPAANSADNLGNIKYFSSGSASQQLVGGKSYTAQVFRTNPTSYEGEYVLIQAASARDVTTLGDTDTEIHNRQMLVVSEVFKTLNEDGYETITVVGYEEGKRNQYTVDVDYYEGNMMNHIWDKSWFSSAEATARMDATDTTERQEKKLLEGDIIRYRVNDAGEIVFLRPVFLSDARVFRADDSNGLNDANRYRALDIASVYKLQNTDMILRYLINKSTGNTQASMALNVDEDGHILSDSTGTVLYSGGQYCEDGVAGAAWTRSAIFDAQGFSVMVYDETQPEGKRVYTGSYADLADTDSGEAASIVIMQFRSSNPRGMVILKLRG
ncbi:S-layer homology domain-containing protein [Ructibacterium gallinarum]|uniref:S-layer homology domain-containing protein n=1 Tax=Ructibacterium gallinarum TaxID=2779355 RepID=A0A9D5LYN0_9FIRM|nr:S-layer homology domain-containing protein [Ructibacterium gallinarum]MBE5040428.1 S-layer homology domain-containing protein [Ructibacterium gallinarum]